MALLDEDKLQGRIYEILQLLRQQQVCCGFVAALWMTQEDGTPVFVLVSPTGAITVLDAPGGSVIADPGVLGPYPQPA